MTNQQIKSLENVRFPGTPNLVLRDKNFEAGMLWGLGVGYPQPSNDYPPPLMRRG